MPLSAAIAAELVSLIDDLHEQMIDERRLARLNQLLADDEDCRCLYIRSALVYQALHSVAANEWKSKHREGEEREQSMVGCRLPLGIGQSLPPEILPSTNFVPPSSPSFGFLATAYHGTVGFFSQEIPFSLLAATVICGLGLLISSVTYVTHRAAQLAGTGTGPGSGERQSSESPSKKITFVGRITGMVDCKWSDDKEFFPPTGYYVSLGRKYKLDSGLMEITYDTGAKVILQGPVTYEVESANGGYLAVGELAARVEEGPGGRGQGTEKAGPKSPGPSHPPRDSLFVVRTPTALVMDLGTEFGVEVNKKGVTRSHVFQGRVVVRAVDAAGKEYGREVTLDENQSVQVAAEGSGNAQDVIVVTTSDTAEKATDAGFVRKLPVVDPRAYSKAVLADEPVFYWTFDEPLGSAIEQVRRLPQQALDMNGFASRRSHRDIGSGLRLGRAADFSYGAGSFESEALGYGTMPRSWAIEFWVQFTDQGSKAAEQGSLSKPWPNSFGGYTHQYVLEAAGPSSPSNHPSVLFDFDCGDPNRPHRELILNSPSGSLKSGPQINDQNWHHVIFAFYGNDDPLGAASRVFIVVDGFFQTVDDCNGFHSSFDLQNKLFVGSDNLKNGPMCGRLDELAIYDLSNLSAERIEARVKELAQRHLAAARPLTQM